MKVQRLLLFLVVVFSVCSVYADSLTGIFSNLRHNKEDGELAGMELFIFPGKYGYAALVQVAEGGRSHALVELKVDKNNIEFTLPDGTPNAGAHFVGKVESDGLYGHFTEGKLAKSEDDRLKRGKSYWQ